MLLKILERTQHSREGTLGQLAQAVDEVFNRNPLGNFLRRSNRTHGASLRGRTAHSIALSAVSSRRRPGETASSAGKLLFPGYVAEIQYPRLRFQAYNGRKKHPWQGVDQRSALESSHEGTCSRSCDRIRAVRQPGFTLVGAGQYAIAKLIPIARQPT